MSLTALRTKSMFNTNYSTSDLIYYVGLMTGLALHTRFLVRWLIFTPLCE